MKKYFDGYASFDWNEMSKDKLVSELIRKCKYISELKTQLATENQKVIIVLKKVKRYVGDKDLDVVKYIDNQIKEYGKEKKMEINWTIDELQFLLKDFCEFCRKNYKKAIGVGQIIISDYIATLLEGSYGA